MPILETRSSLWRSESDCQLDAQALAQRWLGQAQSAHPRGQTARRLVLELRGTLGAGKTTWTRHLLRALGVQGSIKSPSYTVLETYDTPAGEVAHFDFYRFQDPQEWEDAGFRDVYAREGLKLAEWPDKALGLLPAPDLVLMLEAGRTEGERRVSWTAHSELGQTLLGVA
jgi:tRNA threonylcarbamoyladenosine biosynthesis protein TsaE